MVFTFLRKECGELEQAHGWVGSDTGFIAQRQSRCRASGVIERFGQIAPDCEVTGIVPLGAFEQRDGLVKRAMLKCDCPGKGRQAVVLGVVCHGLRGQLRRLIKPAAARRADNALQNLRRGLLSHESSGRVGCAR